MKYNCFREGNITVSGVLKRNTVLYRLWHIEKPYSKCYINELNIKYATTLIYKKNVLHVIPIEHLISSNDITAQLINTQVNPNDTLMSFKYPNELHLYPNKPTYTHMNPNEPHWYPYVPQSYPDELYVSQWKPIILQWTLKIPQLISMIPR